MTIAWLIGAAMLQGLTPPDSNVWEIVARENEREFSIDRASVVRSGDTARIVVRTRVFPTGDDARPTTVVMRIAFDCRSQIGRLEAADAYHGEADFIGSTGGQGLEERVRPDTPSQTAFTAACGER